MFDNHGLCGLLEEGAHEKSPKCLGGNLGDFGGFWGILGNFAKVSAQLFDKLCLCFFVIGFVGDEGVFAVFGHGFGLWMFECADTAFLIGAYPSPQVGSGDAVMVCGTLLAAYVQVVEYGLVFEV